MSDTGMTPRSIAEIFDKRYAALAPLAGVTDSVFRSLCASFGAHPVVTEMVSADGYIRSRGSDKTSRLLRYDESERPVGFQLFGSDPSVVAAAAEKAQDLSPDFIDINAGCPVKKVITRGAGSALMRDPEKLARIVGAVVAVSRVPVTVKIRAGWDHDSINAVEVACRCADTGASAVIVHPRTRSQGFGGDADWSLIRKVREECPVPVIGSGDIRTAEDAVRMRDETGIDYVMVGRGAMGNPWLFTQIADRFAGRTETPLPLFAERLEVPLQQLEDLAAQVSERFAVLNMRKVFSWYSRGARHGSAFRQEVFRADTIEAVRNVVRAFQEATRGEPDDVMDEAPDLGGLVEELE